MNVDIIVTTYKRFNLLPETLKSVANQSYPYWKCWIAEDGESKETYEAIKPFLQDKRFIYLPGTHAGFPAVPRNRGIRQGTAPYVASLDDDDLWLPKKLEDQVAFLENHPHCVLLGCNAFYWEGTKEWDQSRLYFKKNSLGKIGYYKMLIQNRIVHSSAIFRRTAVEKAGLYSEGLNPPIGDDYELWLRIGALGEIWNLTEPLVVFRKTPLVYYSSLGRHDNYKAFANIFDSAINGVRNMPSPLSYPENAHFAAACRRERDFYLAGPRIWGRLRHEIQSEIKRFFNIKKLNHE
jgi:glycosyltransferase involved in cell wall biosynthesis